MKELHAGIAVLIIIATVYSVYILWKEKEIRASLFSFLLGGMLVSPFLLIVVVDLSVSTVVGVDVVFCFCVLAFLFNPKLKEYQPSRPKNKIDERIAMFSRAKMKQGSERFQEYYKEHPEHKSLDDKFREKPGLLNSKAVFYNEFGFAASDASFASIEALFSMIEGRPASDKKKVSPENASEFIKNWTKKLGAIDVGICEMRDYHFYSHKGRGDRFGKEINNSHRYGIAFTVEMSEEFTSSAPYVPIVMESAQQYLNSAVIATQLANFIRSFGYEATSHIDGNYELVCPLVAKDVGLGEIGRMGLLMTPKQGPRVRIAVVTTDFPLIEDKPFDDSSMIHFCTLCKKCSHNCPSQSISFKERELIDETLRWQIDQESCFTYWCTVGTDCGKCMKVCPYSHPNNALHNFIRFGIKHSWLFRVLAVHLDDLFYGKRPRAKEIPNWLQKAQTN